MANEINWAQTMSIDSINESGIAVPQGIFSLSGDIYTPFRRTYISLGGSSGDQNFISAISISMDQNIYTPHPVIVLITTFKTRKALWTACIPGLREEMNQVKATQRQVVGGTFPDRLPSEAHDDAASDTEFYVCLRTAIGNNSVLPTIPRLIINLSGWFVPAPQA